MKNKLKSKAEKTSIYSFILITLLGSALHFAFELSGGSTLVGAFTPVNESVWEHLKLLLFPSIAIGILEYFKYGKHYNSFLAAKSISTVIGILVIVCGFFTYTGIFGENVGVVNIFLFATASAVTSFLTYRITVLDPEILDERASIICLTVITLLTILFTYFTFSPPHIELFRDPVSDDFGIIATIAYN